MKSKKILISAFAVVVITAAAISNVFTGDKSTTLKCYDDLSYKVTGDSTDGYNGGGPRNPPVGN